MCTVVYCMAFRQGEKGVIKTCPGPRKGVHGMAVAAVGGEITEHMVGLCGGHILFAVTIDAFDAQGLET